MKTDAFRERLEEEKVRLETRMASVGKRNPAVPNDWEPVPSELGAEADLADQADVIVSREENTAILADLEARYDAVLAALTRIEKGTYGICSVCGGKIEEARLDADPAAETCKAHLHG
jgi:RNA polymerase-binding transcription factor DksA